jgi:hypothetical protein
MTNLKLLSTGLVAVTMLIAPAMARQNQVAAQRSAVTENVASEAPHDWNGRACVPPPRVGAFATDPWNGGNVPCEPGTAPF